MRTFILRGAICAVIIFCLTNCKKNGDETDPGPTRTYMEATCSDFSTSLYPNIDSTVNFKDAGFVIFDKETNQKYLLSMDVVLDVYTNARATINNPDIFTDQTVVTKYSSQYLQLSPLSTPLQITFQANNDLTADEIKSDLLGYKTIKVDIQSTAIYTMGIFGGPFDPYFSIDPYYNSRDLLRHISKVSLGAFNDESPNEQGDQPLPIEIELRKY